MTEEATGDGRTKEHLLAEIAQLKQRLAEFEGDADIHGHRGPAYFDDRLQDEVARSTRYNYEFSVLLVCLDNLSAYSSKFSKESTEEVLGMFRTIIRDSTRKTDICCRFEPEKYGIILPYTNAPGAKVVAERLRQTVERVFTFKSMTIKLPLTLSVGSVTYPGDAVSYDHMVSVLNDTLSAAQSKGGNCLVMAESNISSKGDRAVDARVVIDNLLIHAIDDEIVRCSRYGQKFALLLLAFNPPEAGAEGKRPDVKMIRDMLQSLIRTTVRTLDRIYLYSENMFALLLPSTDAEGAQTVAQKLIEAVASNPLNLPDGGHINASINIGLAGFPFDDVSREGLIKKAGDALNDSFKRGINNFTSATALVKTANKKSWEVRDWIVRLKEAGPGAIYNMVASLDLTEQYSRPHSQSVARYAMAIGQGMGLSITALRQLRTIALFHDLGKMCMPADIVTKPSQLTAREWQLMHKHPQFGSDILSHFSDFAFCVRPVLSHHERWDGKGYPNGLKGERIPSEARIIAVAEALDDMVTPRPYKQRMQMADAIEELKRNAGTQFDPAMVRALIKAAFKMQKTATR